MSRTACACSSLLSARTHQVFTAVALRASDGCQSRVNVSEVTFRKLADDEIRRYWRSGEPADKAGAYAVQGRAALFIERIAGSYSGIMGLPLFETGELLAASRSARMTEILVNVSPREVRAALVENGVLQEIFLERANRRGLISNIYKGRVSRVLPGMQAAFVDIGLERTAFLHASDIVHPAVGENGKLDEPVDEARTADIQALVSEGGEILVQVLKDPLGTKGARLTTFITIPSRYLVYMPKGRGVGISARIEDEAERQRLRDAANLFVRSDETGGYIVRTAAEGATPDALRADMLFLQKLWAVLGEKAAVTRPGNLVYEDLALAVRVMRDVVSSGVDKVSVDHPRDAPAHAGVRAHVHARHGASASSCTTATGRSSTCTASRRRSRSRWNARCR